MDKGIKQVVILLAHPDIKSSQANKVLMDAVKEMEEVATIYMKCVRKMPIILIYGARLYRRHLLLCFNSRYIGCRLLPC